jgi:hypothetical protein
MKTAIAALAGSLAVLMNAGLAFSCEGSTTLYSDDFSAVDPAWGPTGDGMAIEHGVISMSVKPDFGYIVINEADRYEDFDVCVDVVQHHDDPTTAAGSLLFWGIDTDNFYILDVATNGYYRVLRQVNDVWLSPVAWTLTEGLVNPGEEVNRLRVVGRGNVATAFINGTKVVEFRGRPPEGGGYVGIWGDAPVASGAIMEFDNFSVTSADANLSKSPVYVPPPPPVEEAAEDDAAKG